MLLRCMEASMLFKNIYMYFSKMYFAKVYFCKVHPTCVSSKLCEFILKTSVQKQANNCILEHSRENCLNLDSCLGPIERNKLSSCPVSGFQFTDLKCGGVQKI